MFLVHGQHDPAKVAFDQVAEEQARDRVRISAGPDHGDRVRAQERVQSGLRRAGAVPQRGVETPVGLGVGTLKGVDLDTATDAQDFLRSLGDSLAHAPDPLCRPSTRPVSCSCQRGCRVEGHSDTPPRVPVKPHAGGVGRWQIGADSRTDLRVRRLVLAWPEILDRRKSLSGLAGPSARVEDGTGESVLSGSGHASSTLHDVQDPLSPCWRAQHGCARFELRRAHETVGASSGKYRAGAGSICVARCQPLQEVAP